jgi:VCBS repeat-containing protein
MATVAFDLARGTLGLPAPGPAGTTYDANWSKFVNAIAYTASVAPGLRTATTVPGDGFIFDSSLGDTIIRRATFDGGGVFGTASATAAPLITLDWTGDTALRIELNASWNTIRDFQLTQFTGTQLDLRNWYDVDLRLADAVGRSITIEGAKRGSIWLGDGNDTVTIGVESDNNKGGNTFWVGTGGGNDTVIIRATSTDYYPGAYDGSWTSTTIDAGAGDDIVHGWRSNDTVDGGAGTDTFVLRGLRAGYSIATANGVTTIIDINTADGNDGTDTLRNVEYVRFADGSLLALGGAAPANRAPVAVADIVGVGETASASINLLANDSDPDGNALVVSAISGTATFGTLSLANGVATYTANANWLKAGQTLAETFTYTVSDGSLTSTATLNVTIVGENDAPVVRASSATVTEDQVAVPVPALANATDPDGDTLSLVSASALSGSVTIDGGSIRYTPAASMQALNTGQSAGDTITYTVSDGRTSTTGTIAMTITGITDAPTGPVPTLTVGAGKQFATLAAAVAASRDGDVIGIDAGTYVNDFATINTKITIVGVGGMANLVATGLIGNGKGILVTNTDVTIQNLSFSGAKVADLNGAGIRYQGGNLTVQDSYFHDNENGILANASTTGTITIDDSEFFNNGRGDGYSHGIYIGNIAKLTITDSLFHNANIGHEIKSRAQETVIENSRIFDEPDGTASYSIDLPNGGKATIRGNVIEQGPVSDNPAIIHFGGEGSPYAGSSLLVEHNVVVNHLASSSARMLLNQTTVTASVAGNDVYGLTSGQIASGPASVSGTTYLAADPPLDTSAPWMLIG